MQQHPFAIILAEAGPVLRVSGMQKWFILKQLDDLIIKYGDTTMNNRATKQRLYVNVQYMDGIIHSAPCFEADSRLRDFFNGIECMDECMEREHTKAYETYEQWVALFSNFEITLDSIPEYSQLEHHPYTWDLSHVFLYGDDGRKVFVSLVAGSTQLRLSTMKDQTWHFSIIDLSAVDFHAELKKFAAEHITP